MSAKASARFATVGLILGPYRNLTTLSASILSLHPRCQVLNHAGGRLLRGRRDFLRRFTDGRLDRFCRAALAASAEGRRGDFGGSIVFSHAFDRPELRDAYHARYGDITVKEGATSLVWKESQLVTNRIRTAPTTIDELVTKTERLRFLMPVRNPVDCALSNVRTGHAKRIPGVDPEDVVDVLGAVVEELGWFARLARRYPDRFLLFFQDERPEGVCDGFLSLLELPDDEQWRSAVSQVFDTTGTPYEHPVELLEACDQATRRHLSDLPDVARHVSSLVHVGSG